MGVFILCVLVVIALACAVTATRAGPRRCRPRSRDTARDEFAASIPKYQHNLFIPPVYTPQPNGEFFVYMAQVQQQMLPPPLPATTVYAYGGHTRPHGEVLFSTPG